MNAQSNSSQPSENMDIAYSAQQEQRVHCANCDIEILWPAVVVQDAAYCCTGCAAGGPCTCDYSLYCSVNISGVIHYAAEYGREQEQ
ncbi:MAG: hypothetical protein NVS9B9_26580 [Ktedonobacteraceae bacterium]